MKIESAGGEKISVTLSPEDMNDLKITYEELDYSGIETRRVIWTLLGEAKKVLGKSVNTDNRLLIEATPLNEGGCILLFTELPLPGNEKHRRFIIKKDTEPFLFCAFNEDCFLDSLLHIKNNESFIESKEIYIFDRAYYIILTPKKEYSAKLSLSLSEFGKVFLRCKKAVCQIREKGESLSS